MSVIVVAVLSAKPGLRDSVVEAFRQISPIVHRERGCEMYAAHIEQDGNTVVMVERWTSRADLDAHAKGPALITLNELMSPLLVAPYDAYFLDPVPLGDPVRGVIPEAANRWSR